MASPVAGPPLQPNQAAIDKHNAEYERKIRRYKYNNMAVAALMVLTATFTLIEILVPGAAIALGVLSIVFAIVSAVMLYHNRSPVECCAHHNEHQRGQERTPILEHPAPANPPKPMKIIPRYDSSPADIEHTWRGREAQRAQNVSAAMLARG